MTRALVDQARLAAFGRPFGLLGRWGPPSSLRSETTLAGDDSASTRQDACGEVLVSLAQSLESAGAQSREERKSFGSTFICFIQR